MTNRRRCCEEPDNLRETGSRAEHTMLVCVECGTVLAESDDRGELFADY